MGTQHIDNLRTSVANALLGPSVSRNSALATHCTPNVQDPQLVLVQRVLLAARRFLHRVSTVEQNRFFRLVATHNGAANACKWPAKVLKYHLFKFGWQLGASGHLCINGFVWTHFFVIAQSTLLRLCQGQWQEQVVTYTDRKTLKGLLPICRLSTIQILRKYPPAHQVKLLNEIAGAFQTRTQQAVWDDQVDPHCPHCVANLTPGNMGH